MKYLLVAAALVRGPGCADPRGSIPGFFDKPFPGELIVLRATVQEEMADYCYPAPRAYRVAGCSFHWWPDDDSGKPKCYVYISPQSYLDQWGIRRRVAARWALLHWQEYQDECARRSDVPSSRSAGVRRRP